MVISSLRMSQVEPMVAVGTTVLGIYHYNPEQPLNGEGSHCRHHTRESYTYSLLVAIPNISRSTSSRVPLPSQDFLVRFISIKIKIPFDRKGCGGETIVGKRQIHQRVPHSIIRRERPCQAITMDIKCLQLAPHGVRLGQRP